MSIDVTDGPLARFDVLAEANIAALGRKQVLPRCLKEQSHHTIGKSTAVVSGVKKVRRSSDNPIAQHNGRC
jgi:hypothetical protein